MAKNTSFTLGNNLELLPLLLEAYRTWRIEKKRRTQLHLILSENVPSTNIKPPF